ncbi:MAG: Ty1/Copia family ribonuclease HI, partial [Gaiellaceae bacterium]
LEELVTAFQLEHEGKSTIKSTIWEDNQAAYILATNEPPRLTPRSKHIHVKYHWFREHWEPGTMEVVPIDTKQQLTDIMTKLQPRVEFERF